MNTRAIFLGLMLFVCCGRQEKTDEAVGTESSISAEITQAVRKDTNRAKIDQDKSVFVKAEGKAVLLGSDIQLLGEDYKVIKDITSLSGQLAEITAVSNDYRKQNPSDDPCEVFKYVKVKIGDIEGIVDGRKVYLLLEDKQRISKKIDGNTIGLTATKNFGRDVFDEEGLTGCSILTPAVFSDEKAKYLGLVHMKKNEFHDSDYPYFELKDDDGASDEVENIEKKGNHYLISIKRTYQEGGAKLLVRIGREQNGRYTAEIIKKERTEEYYGR